MVTLELPPPVERTLRARAEGQGLTLEAFLVRVAEREAAPVPAARVPLRGRLVATATDLPLEEFQRVRQEMWSDSPRESSTAEQP